MPHGHVRRRGVGRSFQARQEVPQCGHEKGREGDHDDFRRRQEGKAQQARGKGEVSRKKAWQVTQKAGDSEFDTEDSKCRLYAAGVV